MDLTAARHLIIFGGSFDPPHRAHVTLPQQVREHLKADAVVYVPVGVPAHKKRSQLTASQHRLAMLELALADAKNVAIDTIELERASRGEPTYTVETLEILAKRYPHAQMRLLIGSDQMHAFDTWHEPQRVIELAEPIVMAREDACALPDESWCHRLAPRMPVIDISATALRQCVREGKSIDAWVTPSVAQYIETYGLYQ